MKLASKEDLSNLTKDQYAIIEFGSIFIPGDERSRTHPGHGYPDSYEETTKVYLFSSKEEWEKEIKYKVLNRHSTSKDFQAVIIKPVKIETKVSVSINE